MPDEARNIPEHASFQEATTLQNTQHPPLMTSSTHQQILPSISIPHASSSVNSPLLPISYSSISSDPPFHSARAYMTNNAPSSESIRANSIQSPHSTMAPISIFPQRASDTLPNSRASPSLFRNQSSVSLSGQNSKNGTSLFRTQSSTAVPQISTGDNKRRYSSLFGDSSKFTPSVPASTIPKRPRTLTAPSTFQIITANKHVFDKDILPKLPAFQQQKAVELIQFLSNQIEKSSRQWSLADQQSRAIEAQISTLKQQPSLNKQETLRLESLMNSNMVWVQRTVRSKYLEKFKIMLDKVFKGEVADYAFLYNSATSLAKDGDLEIQQAVEQMSLSSVRTPYTDVRRKSLFSPEATRVNTEESFGPYGPGVGSLDREKIEKLLDNIKADLDIKPIDRKGTPKEMKITLLEHQKLGLAWLQKMEASVKGGILADDMGLGKTIQTM